MGCSRWVPSHEEESRPAASRSERSAMKTNTTADKAIISLINADREFWDNDEPGGKV